MVYSFQVCSGLSGLIDFTLECLQALLSERGFDESSLEVEPLR